MSSLSDCCLQRPHWANQFFWNLASVLLKMDRGALSNKVGSTGSFIITWAALPDLASFRNLLGLPTSLRIKSKLFMIACKSLPALLGLLLLRTSSHTLSSLTTGWSLATCQFFRGLPGSWNVVPSLECCPPPPPPARLPLFYPESQFISLSEQVISDDLFNICFLMFARVHFYFHHIMGQY